MPFISGIIEMASTTTTPTLLFERMISPPNMIPQLPLGKPDLQNQTYVLSKDMQPIFTANPDSHKRKRLTNGIQQSPKYQGASQLRRPAKLRASSEMSVKVIHRQEISTSATHPELQKWSFEIEEARRAHARVEDNQPENPILENGRPRLYFSTYQMLLPSNAMVKHLEASEKYKQDMKESKREWRSQVIAWRLKRNIGLRDWEWSLGEPFETEPTIESDNEQSIEEMSKAAPRRPRSDKDNKIYAKARDAEEDTNTQLSATSAPPKTQSYSQRIRKFSYSRASDPLFRGKRWTYSRRKGLDCEPGYYPDEISAEDLAYVPEEEELFDERSTEEEEEEMFDDGSTACSERPTNTQKFARRTISLD
ncbi:hypothetical protein LTS08_007360 [Lithohypha guttulata]|nr:hypothetical protein LTS08_007360 [Lithohypha guttulata]